jgi:predicted TIM-barrel fold metal-dependent hydrolase
MVARSAKDFIAGNRETARHVEMPKGRFPGACVVNPLFIGEALREIEDCHRRFGFRWIGELCNYIEPAWQYTSKEFAMLAGQAVKLNMVLQVHTELDEMEYIVKTFQKATLVFAHFGDSREEAHIFARIRAVAAHPNCYLDTSGYGHDRMGILEYAVKTIGPDRVLFGSDFAVNDPATVIARIRNAFLTEEEKRKVFSGNVRRLLRTVGPAGV